jgi:uncharacterized membrane protein YidH (DUF202 family)
MMAQLLLAVWIAAKICLFLGGLWHWRRFDRATTTRDMVRHGITAVILLVIATH